MSKKSLRPIWMAIMATMFTVQELGAEETAIAADAFPIARAEIYVTARNSDNLKQYCLKKVSDSIDEVIKELERVSHPMIKGGDVMMTCRRIILVARATKGSSKTKVDFGNIFYIGSDVVSTLYTAGGGEVVAVCEPRNYDEELIYVAARRCREQLTPECLTPEFRDQVRQLGRTQMVNSVDPEKTCDTGYSSNPSSSQSPN